MKHLILVTVIPEEEVLARKFLGYIKDDLAARGAILGIDFTAYIAADGDPFAKDPTEYASVKQRKLIDWKLKTLEDLLIRARRAPSGEIACSTAADVAYITRTELSEIATSGALPKRRASELIDALIEAVDDLQYEISLSHAS